jgi:hypothetical protein
MSAGVIVALVVVGAVVILFFAILLATPIQPQSSFGAGQVVVTQINAYSGDDACGLNGISFGGFTAFSGEFVSVSLYVGGQPSGAPCTIVSISTNTPGFGVSAYLPFTTSEAESNLVISVTTPNSFNGPLNITFS